MKKIILSALCALTLTACSTVDEADVVNKLDHITFSVYDLEQGMQEFEKLTGVKPLYGGKHPGGISHNALVDIGNGIYLEIKAPQENKKAKDSVPLNERYEKLTPVKWMVHSNYIKHLQKKIKKAGFLATSVYGGSRMREDNVLLEYTSFIMTDNGIKHQPAFIKWDNLDYHPTKRLDDFCNLTNLTINSVKPTLHEKIISSLKIKELPIAITASEAPGMSVELDCPKGKVQFSNTL